MHLLQFLLLAVTEGGSRATLTGEVLVEVRLDEGGLNGMSSAITNNAIFRSSPFRSSPLLDRWRVLKELGIKHTSREIFTGGLKLLRWGESWPICLVL